MPKPDLDTVFLVGALERRGHQPQTLPWDAPGDWSQFDLIILRTPWDYVARLDEFLSWVDHAAAISHLLNPPAVVRWNAHKRYLLELDRAGVSVPPTRLLAHGRRTATVDALSSHGQQTVVVKPAVGIGALGAAKGSACDPEFRELVERLVGQGDVLLQPFLPEIQTFGEASLMFLGDVLSHAVRKRPQPGDYRVQDHHGGTVEDKAPTNAMIEIARAALAAAPAPTLYARVDLVATEAGPVVMELELIEPELFLRRSPTAVEILADRIVGVGYAASSAEPKG